MTSLMSKPVILILDDELQVLNTIERDLRKHFQGDYRIIKSTTGKDALETVKKLKERNNSIALFLVDQRMPEMTGTEFLEQASKFEPQARKVLLTAYADTKAAIDSINKIGLDYYLMKPWDPPEQNLYPALDDLLDDWNATVQISFDGIRVAGTRWSSKSYEIKNFLARNSIPYEWLDLEKDSKTKELVKAINSDSKKLPSFVIFFPDGDTLIEPDRETLAQKIGLKTRADHPFYQLIVIGGGLAGLAAGVYGASEGLRTIIIEKEATGGQAGTSSRIENYLGFPKGISGSDLARRATTQAKRLGTEILVPQEVAKIEVKGNQKGPYKVVTLKDGSDLHCFTVIIATGMTVRRLEATDIDRLTGAGVYYGAALSEVSLYRDQDVFVVGGANSAGQGAMYYSRYCRKVIILIRGDSLTKSMSQYLIDQIHTTKNIEVRTHGFVLEVKGKNRLEAIVIGNSITNEIKELPASALFIFIGATPVSKIVSDIVETTSEGYILTGEDLLIKGKRPKNFDRDPYLLETSIPGMFAAGDIRYGSSKRVASAVGEGAVAVRFVHEYLKNV